MTHVHVRDGYPAIQYLPWSNTKWDTYSGYSAVFVFSPPTEGNMSAWITIVKLYDCSWETKITDYLSGELSKNTTPRYSSKRHLQLCACERCTPTKSLQPWKTEVTISIQSVKVTKAKIMLIMLYTERNHMKQYEPIWSAWRHVIVAKLLTSWLCEGIWRDYHGVIGCETNLQMISLQKPQASLFRLDIGWLRPEHTKFNAMMLKTGTKVTITAQAYLTSIHFHHSWQPKRAKTNVQDLF